MHQGRLSTNLEHIHIIDSFGILRTIDYYHIEEIRTVGLGYNLPGDVTENQIRKEHNLNERL